MDVFKTQTKPTRFYVVLTEREILEIDEKKRKVWRHIPLENVGFAEKMRNGVMLHLREPIDDQVSLRGCD